MKSGTMIALLIIGIGVGVGISHLDLSNVTTPLARKLHRHGRGESIHPARPPFSHDSARLDEEASTRASNSSVQEFAVAAAKDHRSEITGCERCLETGRIDLDQSKPVDRQHRRSDRQEQNILLHAVRSTVRTAAANRKTDRADPTAPGSERVHGFLCRTLSGFYRSFVQA
jgi:hypothetical protein